VDDGGCGVCVCVCLSVYVCMYVCVCVSSFVGCDFFRRVEGVCVAFFLLLVLHIGYFDPKFTKR